MKKIVLVLLLLMQFLSGDGQSILEKRDSLYQYKEAISIAEKQDKIVILKLFSSHCRFCKKMEKFVFSNPDILALLDKKFISVSINVEEDELPLGLSYKVTPTFFFITKNEKVVSKIQGSWNKEDFADILEMVLRKVKGEVK